MIFSLPSTVSDIPSFPTLPRLHTIIQCCANPTVIHNDHTNIALFLASIIPLCPNLSTLSVEMAEHGGDGQLVTLKDILSQCSPGAPIPLRRIMLSNALITIDEKTIPHLRNLEIAKNKVSRYRDMQGWTSRSNQRLPLLHEDGTSTLRFLDIDWLDRGGIDVIPPSGLKRLSLAYARDRDNLAHHTFFSTVLPGHYASLVSLHLQTSTAGPWCYSTSVRQSILNCEQLRELSISVSDRDLVGGIVVSISFHPTFATVMCLHCLLLTNVLSVIF